MAYCNMIYPKSLEEVITFYKTLPGIGEKSAERLALASIDLNDETISSMVCNLSKLKELNKCSVCGHICESDVCTVCSDDNRDKNLICVIEDYKSVFAFEKAGNYKGTYHVLNGLISPIDGVGPDDINIASLIKRTKALENPEIIVALKSTVEGETTTLYIKKIFEDSNVKVSRLSYGIPIGADIDYLDFMTLDRALSDRKNIT